MLQKRNSNPPSALENFLTFFQRRKPRNPPRHLALIPEQFSAWSDSPYNGEATGWEAPLPPNRNTCDHDARKWVYCPEGTDAATYLYLKCPEPECGYRHNPWPPKHSKHAEASRAIGQQRVIVFEGRYDDPGRAQLDATALGWTAPKRDGWTPEPDWQEE